MLSEPEIGWSDHTKNQAVIYEAIGQVAEMIEFHLDLDGKGNEYEHGHCWRPDEIWSVIDVVKQMAKAEESGTSTINSMIGCTAVSPQIPTGTIYNTEHD